MTSALGWRECELRVAGVDSRGRADLCVFCQLGHPARVAGARHRGGQATGVADVEGLAGAVSGGVIGAVTAVWDRRQR
jgi:hypothetical protein